MAEEKIVTINFRKLSRGSPRDKRKGKAMHALRAFLEKKSDKVKIDSKLSYNIWSKSSRGTIGKVKIRIKKQDDGTTSAELAS